MQANAARRHVVITGAAGALGRAIAARFAAEGARLSARQTAEGTAKAQSQGLFFQPDQR